MPARACRALGAPGNLFVLKTGIPWTDLPEELGCGSGITCWRRLRAWQAAGVWDGLHRVLLDELGVAGDIDWTRASLDAATVPPGGEQTGKDPTNRGNAKGAPGSKRHLIIDGRGTPLAVVQSGANAHDSTLLEAASDAVPRITTPRGGRRKRPAKRHADKWYDCRRCRQRLRRRHITARIARKGIERGDRLGRHRWKVARTFSWLNRFRRLKIRNERSEDTHQAFLLLACSLICLRRLEGRF